MRVVFDKYTDDAGKLLKMMRRTEPDTGAVALEDDGFLPNTIFSLYEYFVYGQNCEALKEKDLHYSFLKVPEFWEIRTCGAHGAVYDMGCKKANIYYNKLQNVQHVEWLMEDGWIYRIDYYNKYALRYASEFLDTDGKTESKVFYSHRNQEVIVEQPQSGAITLLNEGKIKALFTSREELIEYFFTEAFFTETGSEESRVLFVQDQEGLRLSQRQWGGRCVWESVWFSNSALMNQYIDMGGKNGRRIYFIPEEYPVNDAKGEALILTCSDQLQGIEYLIHELPEVMFHIGANTQVSEKLLKLGQCPNVRIYPQIGREQLSALWSHCDFYFDINHYGEIHNAIDTAHQNNLLILGFENTIHCRELVVEECIFSQSDEKKLAGEMKKLVNQPEAVGERLVKQQKKKREIWERQSGTVLQKEKGI